ncbi:heme-dependent oxidative N-demethylase subunit alpha family protein [Planktomarina sp.]|uniref:heme-dependent oxidative N-demethylase subunit alpha family protein n=1 Tax=Planktomarina sp. TaxID=2024851 RepID=UPI003C445300
MCGLICFSRAAKPPPRSSDEDYGQGAYLRSEHQALVRLPRTGAVLFAIHTYLIKKPT